ACKSCDIVLDGSEGNVDAPGRPVRLESLRVDAHGLNAVGLAGTDVLLLAPGRDGDLAPAQGPDIADDGADPAVEQAEGEVLIAEESALVARLGGEAEDAGAAQALDAMSQADLIVLLGGVEGEPDRDLLALLQGLAGRFFGGDDQERDLPEAELAIGVVGIEGVDLFDGFEDGLRDEGRAIGPLLDLASKQVVEGL